jgi:hypothetical protein
MANLIQLPASYALTQSKLYAARAAVEQAKAKLESTAEFSALKVAENELKEIELFDSEVRRTIGDMMEAEGKETLEVGGQNWKLSYTSGSFKIKDEQKFMELYPQFTKTKTTTEPSVTDAKKAMKEGFIFDPAIASLIQKREITIVE